jgi:hypothetical protein
MKSDLDGCDYFQLFVVNNFIEDTITREPPQEEDYG